MAGLDTLSSYPDAETAAVDWKKLSSNAGIDFGALRNKYAGIAAKNNATPTPATIAQGGVASSSSSSSSMSSSDMDADEIAKTQAALDRLDHVHVCHMCHGSGIQKYVYNHQQRESNCDACDGEGLKRRGGKSIIDPPDDEAAPPVSNDSDAGEVDAGGDNPAPTAAVHYDLSSSEDSMFEAVQPGQQRVEIEDDDDDEEEEEDEPPPIVL